MPIICISKGLFNNQTMPLGSAWIASGWSMNMCYLDIYVDSFIPPFLNEWYSPTKNFEYLQIVFFR